MMKLLIALICRISLVPLLLLGFCSAALAESEKTSFSSIDDLRAYLGSHPTLTSLVIVDNASLTTLPTLPQSIKKLSLQYCAHLTSLPNRLPDLETLELNHCAEL